MIYLLIRLTIWGFGALLVVTVVVLWLAMYLVLGIATGIAMLVGSKWRPRKPAVPSAAAQRAIPQSRFSDRR